MHISRNELCLLIILWIFASICTKHVNVVVTTPTTSILIYAGYYIILSLKENAKVNAKETVGACVSLKVQQKDLCNCIIYLCVSLCDLC